MKCFGFDDIARHIYKMAKFYTCLSFKLHWFYKQTDTIWIVNAFESRNGDDMIYIKYFLFKTGEY